MSISKVPTFSNHSSKHDSFNDLDENHIPRRISAKRILNQNNLMFRKNKQLNFDAAADLLLHEQAEKAESTDVNLFREKLQNQERDARQLLAHDQYNIESAKRNCKNLMLSSDALDSNLTGINQLEKNNQSFSGSDTNSSYFDKSDISSISINSVNFSNLNSFENAIQSSIDQFDQVESDKNILPFDLIDKLSNMGSLIGAGKSNSAINHVKLELVNINATLASYNSKLKELSAADKESLEITIDFLEGYCEASKLEANDRMFLNEQFQVLRENLYLNSQTISAQLQNASTPIDSPLSGISMRAKAAHFALNQPPVSDSNGSFSVIDKNRRLFQSLKEDKKQSEDTLALKVQRSV